MITGVSSDRYCFSAPEQSYLSESLYARNIILLLGNLTVFIEAVKVHNRCKRDHKFDTYMRLHEGTGLSLPLK